MATTAIPWGLRPAPSTSTSEDDNDEQQQNKQGGSPALTSPQVGRDVAFFFSRCLTADSPTWTAQSLNKTCPHDVLCLTSVALEGALETGGGGGGARSWRAQLSERNGGALALLDSAARPSTTMAAVLPADVVLEASFSSSAPTSGALYVFGHILRRQGDMVAAAAGAGEAAAAAGREWWGTVGRGGEEEEAAVAEAPGDLKKKKKKKKLKKDKKKDKKKIKASSDEEEEEEEQAEEPPQQQQQQPEGGNVVVAVGKASDEEAAAPARKKKNKNKKRRGGNGGGGEMEAGMAVWGMPMHQPTTKKIKPQQA
jgi:hypothetical protein